MKAESKLLKESIICVCCGKSFVPDYRNRWHQKYCQKKRCRKASKRASQRKWLDKNPDIYSGPANVLRVRLWREEKRSGSGKMIFKLILEVLVFRRKGRRDRVEVVKKDGDGELLQDISVFRKALNSYVIIRIGSVLQDIIELIVPGRYSFPEKGGKSARRGVSCEGKED